MAIPNGQVLGLSGSDIAPQIIMQGAASIVADLRRTGQEIAANVQRIQTNKQFKAFGQEAATLDPNTPGYIPSLVGLASKYPLAAQSEGGQRMLQSAILAHSPYVKEQASQLDYNRESALEGLRHRNRMRELAERPGSAPVQKDRFGRWVNTRTGEVVQDPIENPIPLREGQGLFSPAGATVVPPLARTTATPFRLGNGFTMDSTTGETTQLPLNEAQKQAVEQRNAALAVREAQLGADALRSEINGLVEEYRNAPEDRKLDIQRRIDNRRSQLDTLLNVTSNIPVQGPSQGAVPLVPDAAVLPAPLTAPRQSEVIQPNPQPLAPPVSKTLDREIARQLLKEAGGDRQKARVKASEMGYKLP